MTTDESRYNNAVKLRTAGELEAAGEIALSLWESGYQTPWTALLIGNLSVDFGRFDKALQFHSLAWELLHPDAPAANLFARDTRDPDLRYEHVFALALAHSRLRLAIWNTATYTLFETGRWRQSWSPSPGTMPYLNQPEKTLVLFEGGYGDAFLFTRFFQRLDPEIRAQSRFVLNPKFPGLDGFRACWDGMPQLGFNESVRDFNFSTALMSLPFLTKCQGPDDIPAPEPWQPAPAFGIPEWDNYDHFNRPPSLAISRGPRLGLCWCAEENGVPRRSRSVENTADLEPLAPFEFVNLNPGYSLPVNGKCPRLLYLPITNWSDTARIVASLDCVVTVDTAILHLAGLLGVPTIALIPLSGDWKYGPSGSECMWWKSVKIVRNQSPYSWKEAVEKASEMLEKL